jgi:heme exporter protein D
MIYNFLNMDGYGVYVFSSFIFTLVSFAGLYFIIKSQLIKEQKKFKAKFSSLTVDKVSAARTQKTNKEILAAGIFSKI